MANEQFTALVAKAKSWADKIQAGNLPRLLSWQSLTTSLIKSLESLFFVDYPSPLTPAPQWANT